MTRCKVISRYGVGVDSVDVAAAPPPAMQPKPTPIPAAEIPTRTSDVNTLVQETNSRARPKEWFTTIADELPSIEERITEYEETAGTLLDTFGSAEVLKSARSEMAPVSAKMDSWAAELGRRAAGLESDLTSLQDEHELWQLTASEAGQAGLPAALVQQVRENLTAIREARKNTEARRNDVLTLQTRVAKSQSRVKNLARDLRDEIDNRQRNLFRVDSPPLWRITREGDPAGAIGDQIVRSFGKNVAEVRSYIKNHTERLVLHAVLLLSLIALFVWLRTKAELWVQSDESLHMAAALLQRPLAASLLVTVVLLDWWIYPDAPVAFLGMLNAVLLLAVPSLLRQMVPPALRPAIWALIGLAVTYLVLEYAPITYFLDRLGQLVLALAGCAVCVWLLRQLGSHRSRPKTGWARAGIVAVKLAGALFAVSIVANVFGAVALASYLVSATLGSAYDAVVLWVLAAVLLSTITVLLRAAPAKRLRIVEYDAETVRATAFRVIRFLAVASWVVFSLDAFGYLDRMVARSKQILGFQLKLGEFELSLSSVVIFVVVVWLSHRISRAVSFVLDRDVLSRLDLPRGAPAAISKISQYLVVTLGFLIAVAAAGFNISQLTIVVGALSVGIGFGMQNIVNNFISGLILLFERPINLGDRVEVGPISGVIKEIGIRATVVRTWDGAEVVVPNATLISDNVVNWTLYDPSRRMNIQIGAAYGTDPQRVIDLLLDIAANHEGVLENPAPVALFVDFAESALIFELRAWTTGDFVTIASELRLRISQGMRNEGIEIPFPQRDLHLRSVESGAVATLAGCETPDGRGKRDTGQARAGDPTTGDESDTIPD